MILSIVQDILAGVGWVGWRQEKDIVELWGWSESKTIWQYCKFGLIGDYTRSDTFSTATSRKDET
jgi:hypothetical protein